MSFAFNGKCPVCDERRNHPKHGDWCSKKIQAEQTGKPTAKLSSSDKTKPLRMDKPERLYGRGRLA